MNFLFRFIADEKGVTAVEYCLIAALVAIATTGAISLVSPDIYSVFKAVAETVPVD